MELKKNPKADLTRQSGLFLNIGLVISLALTISAFEWKFYDDGSLMNLGQVNDNFEDIIEIPPTEQPPPPPPKIQQPEIVEVPDEEEIEELDVDLDVEITEDAVIEDIVFEEAPEEEDVDEIFQIVEDPAGFPGGQGEFNKFLSKNLKYPSQAQRMNIEGVVYVQFVVDKDGALTDIKVAKGIGAGLDEEAIRVLKQSPKWKPGKQRGRAVRQSMIIPIRFKLQ